MNARKLLAAFQAFFRKHSEHWVEGLEYREAGPQLLLQAFLQRVANGGGRVEREYGLGRGRFQRQLARRPLGYLDGRAGGTALRFRTGEPAVVLYRR